VLTCKSPQQSTKILAGLVDVKGSLNLTDEVAGHFSDRMDRFFAEQLVSTQRPSESL
jgi:hypothetical protein